MHRAHGQAMTRGFSLVEALVAATIALALVAVLAELLVGGVRQSDRTEAALEALQASQMVLDRLQTDLRAIHVTDPGKPPLTVEGPDASGVRFVIGRPNPKTGLYAMREVRYGVVPGPKPGLLWLERNGLAYRNLALRRLAFEIVEQPALDGAPQVFLRAHLVATDSRGGQAFGLRAVLSLDAPTRARRSLAWNPNPYTYASN